MARTRGLSPRVRGNRRYAGVSLVAPRSIPACAGEPPPRSRRLRRSRVYPRVCGGTLNDACPQSIRTGLSPRVRGNRSAARPAVPRPGSIPACAGEPAAPTCSTAPSTVYPRVCGGTLDVAFVAASGWGLSPRVRGNRAALDRGRLRDGSIPACAGEPGGGASRVARATVYPRVCGGTLDLKAYDPPGHGLSPRVRGNHSTDLLSPASQRSIPACAGEPVGCCRMWGSRAVYPRVCGGTCEKSKQMKEVVGLSPRVRGNLVTKREQHLWLGSIPRVCGGTVQARQTALKAAGLSPRVRGNRPSPAG